MHFKALLSRTQTARNLPVLTELRSLPGKAGTQGMKPNKHQACAWGGPCYSYPSRLLPLVPQVSAFPVHGQNPK